MTIKSLSHILSIIFLSFFTFGCDSKRQANIDEQTAVFSSKISLECSHKPMGIIIKAGSIYKCGKYILIYDRFNGAEFHYAVFNQNLDYLYSFCRKGNGPGECLMPTIVKNQDSDICFMRDHGNDNFYRFSLNDSCAEFIGTLRLPTSGIDFPFEINQISQDRLLLKSASFNKIRRQLWNLEQITLIDSLPTSFGYENKLKEKYHPEYDDFWMTAEDQKFMCAYFFEKCIEFGKIDKDRLKIVRHWGSLETKDLHWFEADPPSDKYKYNSYYNTVYYESTASGDGSFWAGYAGVPWGELDMHHSQIIERYSLDGIPEVKYELSAPVETFIILDNPNRIIALNPDIYEDSFMIFPL